MIILSTISVKSQSLVDTLWTHTLGGSGMDAVFYAKTAMDIDEDDNIYIATNSVSDDYDVGKNYGLVDCWVLKLNSQGDTLWKTVVGGSGNDVVGSIISDKNGGCILVGTTGSDDGKFISTGHYGDLGEPDGFVAFLDKDGNITKIKQYGSKSFLAHFSDGEEEWIGGKDELYNITETSDGNYMCVGHSNSLDNDLGPIDETQSWASWFLKINPEGKKISSKKISHPDEEDIWYLSYAYDIIETKEGDFVCLGELFSSQFLSYFWVFRTDGVDNTKKKWSKIYTSYSFQTQAGIVKKNDDTYIVCGGIAEANGNVTETGKGSSDAWVFEIDADSGDITNQKLFGGSELDKPYNILKLKNDNYLMSGYSTSNDGDAPGSFGKKDFWMLEFDDNLDTLWTSKAGGTMHDVIYDVKESNNGNSFYTVGITESNDYFINNNNGNYDIWVSKIEFPTITVNNIENSTNIKCSPNPSSGIFEITNCRGKTVSVTDLLGKQIYSLKISGNKETINLSSITKGIYFMNIENKKEGIKIIIN